MNERALKKSRGVEVLFALLEGPKGFTELSSDAGGSLSTIKLRVEELIDSGVIKEEKWESFPFKRVLELTDKGHRIARMLKSIEEASGEVRKKPSMPKERGEWILALLHTLGGEIRGSTRLQKLLFLFREKFKVVEDDFYEFEPLHYGSFSWEIVKDAEALERTGLIDVKTEVLETGENFSEDGAFRRTYNLSAEGEEIAREIYNALPEKIKHALLSLRGFNYMTLEKLVEYIYSNYPDYKPKG